MKFPTTLVSGLCPAVLILLFAAQRPLLAEPIGPHNPGSVQSGCKATGGTYFPPKPINHGVYGCWEQNGSGIVCGGLGDYKTTCTYSNIAVPPRKRLTSELHEDYIKRISAR